MEEYRSVSCLFCTTGKENSVVEIIHQNSWGQAIFPVRTSFMRIEGKWNETVKPLLPGYVFVYFPEEQVSHEKVVAIPYVIRVLSYGIGQDTLTGRI